MDGPNDGPTDGPTDGQTDAWADRQTGLHAWKEPFGLKQGRIHGPKSLLEGRNAKA